MLSVPEDADTDSMIGYRFSKMEIESELSDGSSDDGGGSSWPSQKPDSLDQDIAQLTKLQSRPNEHFSSVSPRKHDFPISTLKMLAGREANLSGRGRFSLADCRHVLSRYLPVYGPCIVDQMSTRAYVSQFSADGSLLIAAFQGSQIRIYDVEKGWKVRKNILARSLRWTITDTSLSPDQQWLVYASMSPVIQIVDAGSDTCESLANITEVHDGLDLSSHDDGGYSFGIFSLQFSTDGQEVVAGSSDGDIHVCDLNTKKVSLHISAHTSDVNSVCFVDESGHLIFSGSDDSFCKVWDRRCFAGSGKPAGVLMGHLEGITFIDSRRDGRYLISNSKDQAIKLWDLRKMSSNSICYQGYRNYEWDYRWMNYPQQARDFKHPHDQSVATYKGHSVLRTLIRCYFSPQYSTGQKYIYTGSHDSCIYIYDLVSGDQVAKLKHHRSTVRDCSWHPTYPMLVSSSWDGEVVKWEFPGDGDAATATISNTNLYDPRLQAQNLFNNLLLR
ncbi:LEC14B protein-like isoform X2 [Salvia miltiorrhiza]|nr:LEC14B protein-like isoform X2 [Salvia miltiorrhiza]XP_057776594.1 LEC14B protein-like isoform X2 [Salvia miltiorrhiza]XP_057776595.1 LEC14B protein-like isoform X2 [Salvia miltiorrhiza]